MRWGELAALTVDDIDETARTIRVHRAFAEDTNGATWLQLPKNRRTRTTVYPAFLQPRQDTVVAEATQTRICKSLGLPNRPQERIASVD